MGMDTFLKRLPVAHRGLHDTEKPENSLAAYRAAAEHGYAIETDIRFTKDKELLILHDDTFERMAGDPRKVSECTMSEIKALKLGGTDEPIPTVKEFLETVGGRVPLLIEIKDMPDVKGKEIAKALSDAMQGYAGEYAVQSFNPLYVKAYKKLHPEVMCGVLASTGMYQKTDPFRWRTKMYLVSRLKLNFYIKPDFVSYDMWSLPQPWVTKYRGVKLAWTVNTHELEEKARTYVDNIIFEGYLAEIPKA